MALPADVTQIWDYLRKAGYNATAAAGILGNIGEETGGSFSPEQREAGGGGGTGLIQWTPSTAAYPVQPIVTGNASTDLHAQLADLVAWAKGNGAGPGVLNQAGSVARATQEFMTKAERPGVPNLSARQNWAARVYASLKGVSATASTPAAAHATAKYNPGTQGSTAAAAAGSQGAAAASLPTLTDAQASASHNVWTQLLWAFLGTGALAIIASFNEQLGRVLLALMVGFLVVWLILHDNWIGSVLGGITGS